MAGIGFRLQALAERGGLVGSLHAYGYASVLVAGPWIFTVLALAGITHALSPTTTWEEVQTFRSIVIYNFCASLVLSGPIVLLGTRYLADRIYDRDLSHASFALIASLGSVAMLTFLVAAPFYFLAVDLTPELLASAVVNFGLVTGIWVTVPFLSILRRFGHVAAAFALAAFGCVALAAFVPVRLDDVAVLAILNGALAALLAVVLGRLFADYPSRIVSDPRWKVFLRSRWELAPIGLSYYLGIWIDKIIVWNADVAGTVTVGGVLRTTPGYDSAMFKCQLLAIPAFVYFFVHVETRYHVLFRSLYESFERHATLATIEERTRRIGRFALDRLLRILAALLLAALLLIAVARGFPEVAGLNAMQGGVFRVGIVGTAFHTTFLFAIVFLLYFDLRGHTLRLTLLCLAANAALTLAFLPLGPAYYGTGYMLAAALSLLAAMAVLRRELPWLPYHAFVTNNDALRADRRRPSPRYRLPRS